MEHRSYWAFKIGLLILVLMWFSFTLYQFAKSIYNFDVRIAFTDLPGTIGLGIRTAGSFIALALLIFYLTKKALPAAKAKTYLRWIVFFEAVYWVSFFPAGIWALQKTSFDIYTSEFFIIGTGIPCLVQATVMPAVLVMLFLKLSHKKPVKDAINWGLIAAAAYIFVIWLNYSIQWLSEIILRKDASFIGQYAVNALSFALTTGGLFLLALYAVIYAKQSTGTETLSELDLKKAGAILTLFGLYFSVTYLLTILSGNPEELTTVWHIFFVDHNVDLWLLALPLAGIPLLLSKNQRN